jgi:aryl-alcohol dehydrogenase-like predicted oxidoreductase
VAFTYNLLFRRGKQRVMTIAGQRHIASIVGGIFLGGLIEVHPEWIASKPGWMHPEMHKRLPRLYQLQQESGLSLVALAVRYLVADPQISTILVGAGKPAELDESVFAAMAGPLPHDLHQAIDELGIP